MCKICHRCVNRELPFSPVCFTWYPSVRSPVLRFTPEVQCLQWTDQPSQRLSVPQPPSASWLCWCDWNQKDFYWYFDNSVSPDLLNLYLNTKIASLRTDTHLFSAVFSIACILSSIVDLMRNLWTNVGLVERGNKNEHLFSFLFSRGWII